MPLPLLMLNMCSLVFVQPLRALVVNITSSKVSYLPSESVTVVVSTRDAWTNAAVPAVVGITVTDEAGVQVSHRELHLH